MDGTPHEHEHRADAAWGRSNGAPTARQRVGAANAVRRLLDALAPERTPPRHWEPRSALQRYRSPRGCILQGDVGAVSVSWFPGAATDETLGELQVIAWTGVVTLPGVARRAVGGARWVAEDLLRPVESAGDQWSWRAADGTVLDAAALVARCLDLLTPGVTPPGSPATGA